MSTTISNSDKTTANDRPEVVITDETAGIHACVRTVDNVNRLCVDSTLQATGIGDIFIEHAENGTYSDEMAQDGSVTPVVYEITADATQDIYIEEMRFYGADNGIKLGAYFLAISGALTNGILVTIKSDDIVTTFDTIKTTSDFKNHFSFGAPGFQLIIASNIDEFLAPFHFDNPFPLRKQGTYATDDYISISIRDDIDAVSSLEFLAKGFKRTP